jgi:hypothetical protein
MKKYFLLMLITLSLGFTACSDDDTEATLSSVSIANEGEQTEIVQNGVLTLVAKYNCNMTPKFEWKVDNEVKSNEATFNFSSEKLGEHIITLTVSIGEIEENATIKVSVYGKYKKGTFILNEGSAGRTNSHLIFISPDYEVTKEAYYEVNGSHLGDVSQDLYINNGKIYIISQGAYNNTSTMGVTIANAETLEKIAVYHDELSDLSMPTNIVATDEDNLYIRDSQGIHLFNPSTKTIALIEGTERAVQTRMAVSKGKVFTAKGNSIIVIQGKNVIGTKELNSTPNGILKADDGNIWVSTSNSISKLSSTDYSIIKTNNLEGYQLSAYGSPAVSVKGNTFYFNNNFDIKIYKHDFTTETTEMLYNVGENVENANIVYGSVAVNPANGDVYMNTIKDYSEYTTNTISIFNFEYDKEPLLHNLKNYTSFPSGIYFTESFE